MNYSCLLLFSTGFLQNSIVPTKIFLFLHGKLDINHTYALIGVIDEESK